MAKDRDGQETGGGLFLIMSDAGGNDHVLYKGSNYVVRSAAPVPMGTWTHVAVTKSGATSTLYAGSATPVVKTADAAFVHSGAGSSGRSSARRTGSSRPHSDGLPIAARPCRVDDAPERDQTLGPMSSKHTSLSLLVLAVGLVACSKDKPSEVSTTAAQPTGTTMAGGTTKPAEVAPSPTTPASPSLGSPVLVFKEGLNTPESVLYDAESDQYIVSNINGDPLASDGNGYIAKLSPDGKVVEQKWIEGKKKGVTLNAPKGLAIAGDKLYVSDIETVRIFDKKTGAPAGEVKIPGGTFVNDLATGPDGRVLVSDSGLKSGKQSMEPSGTDAVYAIDKDKKLTTIAKGKELGGPNGILARPDKTWIVGFQSGEMYSLDAKGTRADVQKFPKGSLDGIVALPNGDFLVSSWDASGVFRGKPGGSFTIVLEGVKAPADIGYDTKRNRLLVPLFQDNEVRVYDVK